MQTCQIHFSRARKRDAGYRMLPNILQKFKKAQHCIVNSSKLWPALLLNSSEEAFSSASEFGTSFFQTEWPHLLIPDSFSFDWSHLHNCTPKLISCKVAIRLNCCCVRQYRQSLNCSTATLIFLCIWCNSQLKARQVSLPSHIPLQIFSFFCFSPRLLLHL